MTLFQPALRRLRNRFRPPKREGGGPPYDLVTDVRAFLEDHRARTDHWFFLARVALGISLAGYLVMDTTAGGYGQTWMLLLLAYLLANLTIRLLSVWTSFDYARWLYAGADVLLLLTGRTLLAPHATFDPDAVFVGLFTLLLVGYTLYSDPRLSGTLALATVCVTGVVLIMESIGGAPTPPPLWLLLMLVHLAAVSLITYVLSARLRTLVLGYSVEFQKRSRAAMTTALERARRTKLEDLNQLKRDFISVLSHELRTPITPLRSSIEMARTALRHHAEAHEQLDIAHDATVRLQRLVHDYTRLAELLTLESNTLLRWNVRLTDLMNVLLGGTRRAQFDLHGLDGLIVSTDPRLLGGALLALLRRAELLTPPGLSVTVRGTARDQSVVVSIHDPVSYLEEEALLTLDDPFALSSERTYFSPNTGIELILAQHSIRRLGGNLRIESAYGRGTIVHCTLPGAQHGTQWLHGDKLRYELESIVL